LEQLIQVFWLVKSASRGSREQYPWRHALLTLHHTFSYYDPERTGSDRKRAEFFQVEYALKVKVQWGVA
jgi:hypothetical protein